MQLLRLIAAEGHHSFQPSSTARWSVYATFVSSILSILGSILIIATFILWKDVRQSTARVILLFLAIADLGTALGYLMAAIGFEVYFATEDFYNHTKGYDDFCRVQSFITTFFPVCSFFWTSIMGFYFLVALVFRRPRWGPKLLVIFNVIGWGAPFVLLVIMASLHVLGPVYNQSGSTSASAAWCFVSSNASFDLTNGHYRYLIYEGVCGKFWEFMSYFIVIVCYAVIPISYRSRCTKVSSFLLYAFLPKCCFSFLKETKWHC